MRISGCTVVRNAVIMGYPVVEAIRSILPLVDEYVVAVGRSDPKLRIVDTIWDTTKTTGGLILSEKTNEALAHCTGDWIFYLQADEVVHEDDLPRIRAACARHLDDARVEGLLFRYVHFYASYSVVATSRYWYRNEVRIVRAGRGVASVGDAQSFLVGGPAGRKPRVMRSDGTIMHYGWVKPPEQMGVKHLHFNRWYKGDADDAKYGEGYRFPMQYGLRRWHGAHPHVMHERVRTQSWRFEPEVRPGDWTRKDWRALASDLLERATGKLWGERRKYVLLER
ncbi:MAG: hypothetical protein MUF40_02505 [Gemmatimonadaceae bacterium]|nr:hypothetical protein [Gemmatimonadaceae bacterium]